MQPIVKNHPATKILPTKQQAFPGDKSLPFFKPFIQAKLSINRPNDIYEQEADAMSEKVMRMTNGSANNSFFLGPSITLVQRKCEHCEAEEGQQLQRKETNHPPRMNDSSTGSDFFFKPAISTIQKKCEQCEEEEEQQLQRKETNDSGITADEGLDNYVGSLSGSGQPLPTEARSFFEPRFGYGFGDVKVHTDASAAKSAQSINALAYTSGNNIVFNNGQYAPDTDSGKRLLGHELTHVVQQNSSVERKMIQRAENDSSVGCTALTDTRSDVNSLVNRELASLRPAAAPALISGIRRGIGSDMLTSPGRTQIEGWAASLPPTKAHQPAAAATKYSGVTFVLWSNPIFPILNPTMKVSGVCIGSDKLGHFFQQGHEYYEESHRTGGSLATAIVGGQRQEAGGYGLRTTGVYSNADLEANRKGLDFYNDLAATPTMAFDISSYINANWSEVNNLNFYESSTGQIVWRNLLTGSWAGFFEDNAATMSRRVTTSLIVDPSNNTSITGTFSHNAGTGTLSGNITHNTIAPSGAASGTSAISGVTINFDWVSGLTSGKGVWHNRRENELVGTWGNGTSNNNGGNWGIMK